MVSRHIAQFGAHRSSANAEAMSPQICHVTSKGQVIKGSLDFMDGKSFRYVITLTERRETERDRERHRETERDTERHRETEKDREQIRMNPWQN